jgi:hypothetical protein
MRDESQDQVFEKPPLNSSPQKPLLHSAAPGNRIARRSKKDVDSREERRAGKKIQSLAFRARWTPVRVKKTRQKNKLEPVQNR